MSQSHRSSLKSTSSASIRESFTSSNKSVTFNDTVVQRSSKDGGSGSVGDGVNESEKNIVTSSQDFWDWRSSFSDIGGGQKVLLASTLSSHGMIHIPRNTVLQQESLQLTDNFSDRAQSSKAMLKWSGTGSLPLIAGNEELLVPRRNSERVHVIFPFGRNSPLSVATPSNGESPIHAHVHPPTTANQSAQTRSVRFDRRRPQTLELRRGSSPSFVGGGCSEVDSYLMAEQKSLRRANFVIGVIATLIFLLCVAMVAVTLYFTPVMNQFANQRHGNSTVFDHPIIGFDDPQKGRTNKPLEKETNLSTQEQKGPVSSNSEISSSSSNSSNNQKSKQEEQTKLTQKVPHAPQQFHKRLEIT